MEKLKVAVLLGGDRSLSKKKKMKLSENVIGNYVVDVGWGSKSEWFVWLLGGGEDVLRGQNNGGLMVVSEA